MGQGVGRRERHDERENKHAESPQAVSRDLALERQVDRSEAEQETGA